MRIIGCSLFFTTNKHVLSTKTCETEGRARSPPSTYCHAENQGKISSGVFIVLRDRMDFHSTTYSQTDCTRIRRNELRSLFWPLKKFPGKNLWLLRITTQKYGRRWYRRRQLVSSFRLILGNEPPEVFDIYHKKPHACGCHDSVRYQLVNVRTRYSPSTQKYGRRWYRRRRPVSSFKPVLGNEPPQLFGIYHKKLHACGCHDSARYQLVKVRIRISAVMTFVPTCSAH